MFNRFKHVVMFWNHLDHVWVFNTLYKYLLIDFCTKRREPASRPKAAVLRYQIVSNVIYA